MRNLRPHVSAVLVVDDEEAALRYSVRALQVAGFACDGVSGVQEAREALEHAEYDLLLTDLNLMDGTGTELLRWVAKHYEFLPVVLMTGFPTVHSAVEALRLDAVDYLTKPCEQLAETVQGALDRAQSRRRDCQSMRDCALTLHKVADELDRRLGPDKTTSLDSAFLGTSDAKPMWRLLSPREREVTELLVAGRAVGDIAGQLGITGNTVRNHLKSSFRKFNVSSQVELVRKILGG